MGRVENEHWDIIFYEDRAGRSEIHEFLESRSDREQGKIAAWLSMLQEQGPQLPRPYADVLEDGIHELRIKLSGSQYVFFISSAIGGILS